MTAALIGGAAWLMTHPEIVQGIGLWNTPPDYQQVLDDSDLDIPVDVQEICEKWGAEYNISPELLEAICYRESRFNPTAVNGHNKGIAQINQLWQSDRMARLGVTDLYDADQCIHVAADLLNELSEQYEVAESLGYYRWGFDQADRTQATGEICEYAESVMKRAKAYEIQHGK